MQHFVYGIQEYRFKKLLSKDFEVKVASLLDFSTRLSFGEENFLPQLLAKCKKR